MAHHVDVGGGAAASIGAFREVFQEGVIIPPVKFMQAGQLVPDVSRLVLAQVRAKREVAGDFRAQVAANHTGGRRLCGLATRLGTDGLRRHSAQLLAYTPIELQKAFALYRAAASKLKGGSTAMGTPTGQFGSRSP